MYTIVTGKPTDQKIFVLGVMTTACLETFVEYGEFQGLIRDAKDFFQIFHARENVAVL